MPVNRYKVPESARLSDSQTPDRGTDAEGESIHSDSETGDMVDIDSAAPNFQAEDRAEDRKFLAMLQLAPRSAVETTAANSSAPVSRSESPSGNERVEAVTHLSNGTKSNVSNSILFTITVAKKTCFIE